MRNKQPKYKLGERVTVACGNELITATVVGIAIDDPYWIRVGGPDIIYAVDVHSRTRGGNVKSFILKLLRKDGSVYREYKEYEIDEVAEKLGINSEELNRCG